MTTVHLQVLQDRLEKVNHQVKDLESKAQSLQLTIDRLSVSLAKSEEQGTSHKDKVRSRVALTNLDNLMKCIGDYGKLLIFIKEQNMRSRSRKQRAGQTPFENIESLENTVVPHPVCCVVFCRCSL